MSISMTHIMIFAAAFAGTALLIAIAQTRHLYRWIRRRPAREEIMLGDDMRGRTGRITEIDENGCVFIMVGTERWRAKCDARFSGDLHVGTNVRIQHLKGLTAFIRPEK